MELLKLMCIFLLILIRIHQSTGFTRDPVNQTVPVNTTALFSCTPEGADSASVSWSVYFPDVKKFYVDTDPDHTEILKARGFTFSYNDTASFMNVSATALNNRTNSRCRIFHVVFSSVFSEIAYLTVLGLPLPPGVMVTHPSPLEILLVWVEPFTWPKFPILNYTIIETEVATGRSTIFTSHTLNHSHISSRIATQCIELQFTVLATSDIGTSDPAVVMTGLPISPANTFGDLKVAVHFRSTGDPEVMVFIKPPPVCDFQMAKLTLKVLQDGDTDIMLVGTRAYSGAPPNITFHVTMALVPNTNYTVIAMVITVAGNVTGYNHFNTLLMYPSTERGLRASLIGGICGGLLCLIFLAFLLIIFVYVIQKYRKKHHSSFSSLPEQQTKSKELIN